MPELLIATSNPGKLSEIQAILGDLPCQLLTPDAIGVQIEVDETGHSYAENAALKARAFCQASNRVTLADDSGLEVEALDGLPGLRSARFSPLPNASDADRRGYLLSLLKGKPRPWKARFRCTIALAYPDGRCQFAEGECTGEIIPEERGSHGFGYDPIFLLPELGCTMAELTDQQKNRLSHRAMALQAVRPLLEAWLGG
jgi:XTP/dITP diphosphohydrolase